MGNILEFLHKFFFIGLVCIFFSDAIFLFMRSKNSKIRRTMAYVLSLWGLVYFFALIANISETPPDINGLFRVNVIIVGHYYITFMFIFPMQVLIPGWLNWKRLFLLFLPIIILSGAYYAILALLDQTVEGITSYSMLIDSIGHFNVWFRFVFLLANVLYITVMLKWLYGYEKKYILWKNNNYADQDYVDISWMRGYDILMVLISVFYLGVLAFGGLLSVVLHTLVVMIGFSYLFYKALFYESPYPEDFFASKDENCLVDKSSDAFVIASNNEELEITDQTFENKIYQYVTLIREWMDEEKPYLYREFKLTDVSRVLPLNRSYLSRVFNEGFGRNFSEVVRAYRVEYSKEIIRKKPHLPLYTVAELSGFSSDSTFIRAFKQVEEMTPNQYKLLQLK